MAGTVTITGVSAGLLGGEKILGPISVVGTSIVGSIIDQVLTTGDNTFTIPAGAIGCVFIPPAGTTATVKYRTSTNSADGGLPISGSQPFVHVFSGAPTTVILNTTGTTGTCELWFW
jgi:hypothetical protein